jgi:cystathionine gamma-synthase/methionine-gamma-lyase
MMIRSDALESPIGVTGVHGARPPQPSNTPAAPPVYQASAWEFSSVAEARAAFEEDTAAVAYGTLGAPNQRGLENAIREFHGGEDAAVTSGGMAALAATFLALLRPGDRVVASEDLFGVTASLLRDLASWDIETSFVPMNEPASVDAALKAKRPRLVLAETISNPRVRVPDLSWLSGVARGHSALLVIDNTFATPFHCRPLQHGADIVIESVTKALGGHNDVVLGAVVGSKKTMPPIRRWINRTSMAPGAFAAWLAARSLASFPLRQKQASESALHLARWLSSQDAVRSVHYPGLSEHPDHDVARKVLVRGFGAIVSFELSADLAMTERFLAGLSRIRLVMSLGGPATVLTHPETTTHRLLSVEEREKLGLHAGFLRMSVGLEEWTSIKDDLGHGLSRLETERAVSEERDRAADGSVTRDV